ncbi:glycoside hydrolase family 72 protein [Hortaea werneckii]|nr:glycoside hydrolase family 72 protein [Hortaea werneckii]
MAPVSSFLASSLALLSSTALAANPIKVQEQEFIDTKTDERFVIVGVDYQPGGSAAVGTGNGDPLSNAEECRRDAALMQNMGVNTIRSYNLNSELNHDECASIFNSVGIYMIIDVNSPLDNGHINRDDPSSTYTSEYLTHVFKVIEAFKSYPNTLGFFAGNEIINDVPTASDNPQYIRAVQRDMKQYIAQNADREIPVGYSAADVREVLEDTWAYLQCDNSNNGDSDSRSDFFGLNSYSWCGGDATFQTSGYDDLVSMFSNTTLPVFFSEYGCNQVTPRVFDEVQALYGPRMTVLSGGLVYEWTQEADDFGLVNTTSDGNAQLTTDFENLKSQYDKLNTTLLQSQNDTATSLEAPQCDASLISSDAFSTTFDIPSQPDGVADLISNGIDNAPTGSIVSVTQTSVGATVYATNGGEISGLQINPVEGANAPGSGGNGGSGLSTGAASSRTATSSSSGGNGGSSSTQSSSGSEASNTSSGSSSGSSTSTGSGSSDESSTATSSGSAASSTESEGTAFHVDGKMASSAGLAAAIGAVAFAL